MRGSIEEYHRLNTEIKNVSRRMKIKRVLIISMIQLELLGRITRKADNLTRQHHIGVKRESREPATKRTYGCWNYGLHYIGGCGEPRSPTC